VSPWREFPFHKAPRSTHDAFVRLALPAGGADDSNKQRLGGRPKPERGPLGRPGHGKIHQSSDAKSARQASVDCRLDKSWGKEGERYRHPDRAFSLPLASRDRFQSSGRIGHKFVEPPLRVAQRVDENETRLGLHGTKGRDVFAVALDDLAAPIGRCRLPRDDQGAVQRIVGRGFDQPNLDLCPADRDAFNRGAQSGARCPSGTRIERRSSDMGAALRIASVTRCSISPADTRATDPASCLRPCRIACET